MSVGYKKTAVNVLNGIFLLVLSLIQFAPVRLLNIGLAVPMLAIGFTVSVAYYMGEHYGLAWGIAAGMCFDALSASKICFSTISLALIGLIAGLLITYVFNRNIGALCVTFIIASVAYFGADVIVKLFSKHTDCAAYLLKYSIPSAIYTVVLGIIISFIYSFAINKLKTN